MQDRFGTALERLLASWLLLWGLFGWLPLVRCLFDGTSYEWGTTWFGIPVGGSGLTPAAILLGIKVVAVITTLHVLLRRVTPWNFVLPLGWTGLVTADGVYGLLANPDGFWFHGDTLGIHINLGMVVPAFNGSFLIIAAAHAWRRRSAPDERLFLDAANLRWIAGLLALLPVQFVLLRFGEPHGASDQAGVVLTIVQWFLLGAALRRIGATEGSAAGRRSAAGSAEPA